MKPRTLWSVLAAVGVGVGSAMALHASDHDDGENDVKARALNLTDLYVFREGDQTGNLADNANLVFVMNTNPRSVARQQYYFSTQAAYEFHVSRRSDVNAPVGTSDDVLLRFTFGERDSQNRQAMTVRATLDGNTFTSSARSDNSQPVFTTPLGEPDPSPVVSPVSLSGSELAVFAGLREDPFFFDVEQYFRVRAGVLNTGPDVAFRPASEAVDFTSGYNVNAIVVRIPIAFLAGPTSATTFDVWETISLP